MARLVLRIALEELLARSASFTAVGSREGARMPELGIVSSQLHFVLP
jgi:hypothetical protein